MIENKPTYKGVEKISKKKVKNFFNFKQKIWQGINQHLLPISVILKN